MSGREVVAGGLAFKKMDVAWCWQYERQNITATVRRMQKAEDGWKAEVTMWEVRGSVSATRYADKDGAFCAAAALVQAFQSSPQLAEALRGSGNHGVSPSPRALGDGT